MSANSLLKRITSSLAGFAGLFLVASSVPATAAQQEHDPHAHHRHMMHQPGYKKSINAYEIPALQLIDMHNNNVSLSDVLNSEQPVMLNFIFTTCTTICPVLSATFSQVQKKLGAEAENVLMISVTIDPEQDTPARLKEYAARFNAGSGWQFLTGSLDDIISTQKAFDAYRGDKMNHIPLIFLRNGPNDPWVRLEGFASATEIVAEYHQHQH